MILQHTYDIEEKKKKKKNNNTHITYIIQQSSKLYKSLDDFYILYNKLSRYSI